MTYIHKTLEEKDIPKAARSSFYMLVTSGIGKFIIELHDV